MRPVPFCHPGESRDPANRRWPVCRWIPAFAGMTFPGFVLGGKEKSSAAPGFRPLSSLAAWRPRPNRNAALVKRCGPSGQAGG